MKAFFKNLVAAFKTRYFLKHLAYAVVTLILLVFGIKWGLKSYTHHDSAYEIELPNLKGLSMQQVSETLDPLGLEYEVSDTIFSVEGAKGTVWLQVPGPSKLTKQKVKKGRMIYLTLVSPNPKMVTVPFLSGKSRRHAEGLLKIIGLKSTVKYVPSNYNDAVEEARYKGKKIEKGYKIARGETITLMVGQKSGEKVSVVDLIGLTIDQAQQRLSNSSLTMYLNCEDCKTSKDSASAVAYRQEPGAGADVAAGTEIVVWFTNNKDKTKNDDQK